MEWFSKNRHWISATILFGLSAVLRFLAEIKTVHPAGWDGYYYVMQVHSWLTYGHLQAPDFSLIYPFFTVFTFLAGDPIIGFKVGVAVLAGLLTIAVYFYLVKQHVSWTVACLACSYVVFSPMVTYFILQFPKNTLGLVFLISLISRLRPVRVTLRDGVVTAILFFATIIAHRMTGVFALIPMGIYAFQSIHWKWIVAGGLIVIALGFLPGILHLSDLARLNGQFTPMPHWAPFLFGKIFRGLLDWLFLGDLVLISIVAGMAIVFPAPRFRKQSIQEWTWFCIVLIALFPFFQFGGGAIGYRFFMIAPVALTLLIAGFIKPTPRLAQAVTGLFIVLSFFSFRSYKPGFDAPNEAYSTIVERLVKRYDPKTYPLVIVHKSLAEIIIFKTDFDALNWLPPEDAPSENVLRITYMIQRSDFGKYLKTDDLLKVNTIAMNYVVVPENVWQKFVAGVRNNKDSNLLRRIYSEKNPTDKRPYFINKGRTR